MGAAVWQSGVRCDPHSEKKVSSALVTASRVYTLCTYSATQAENRSADLLANLPAVSLTPGQHTGTRICPMSDADMP